MKQLLLMFMAFLAFSFTSKEVNHPADHTHSSFVLLQNDKAFLRDYYRKTGNDLQKSVENLSEAQLQYKPSAEEWSISQCLEHIILTEKMLFDMTKESLDKPANPERRNEVEVTDQKIIDGITDRSSKVKASEGLQPKGIYTDQKTALDDLTNQRAEILALIEKVSIDDLRNHISDSPFGATDAYHWLLFIAGHTARHTLQIEEVKATDGFPTN
ncbi:DinB family protein [Parapedobacter tibetensis]|uniref:DinB family protein n=1 Tax=Parapedobacter tibetensis TaxID=2972951 RepID=UPI00214D3EED|nr:DinB family protein [Parapedobacter tibetensis]